MIKLTIPALPVRNMKGTGKTSGKPYDINIQTVYCHVSDQNGQPLPYPEKSEIMLATGQSPFAPGDYTLSPDSLYVDRQGKLSVSPKLVALKPRV